MIERVAQAIENAMSSDDNSPSDLARAAIGSMRDYLAGELPDSLLDAYSDAEEYGDHPVEHSFNRRRFAAMIDAALK